MTEHADGDEKEAREGVPEGYHLGHYLVRVVGFRDSEPRYERAHGERETEERGQPGGAQTDQHYGQYEDLPVPELYDLLEYPRYDERHPHDYYRECHQ
jgi:hypothetical protein